MLKWLLKTIRVNDELVTHLDSAQFAVQRPAWLVLGLVLLVPAAYFIVRRQRTHLASTPRSLRAALTTTRVAILTMLVLVLAGPYLKLDETIQKKPIVAVLLDQSRSMLLPAGPFETETEATRLARAAGYATAEGRIEPEARKALNQVGRAKLVREVIKVGAKGLTEPLAEKYELRYYTFGKGLTALGVDPAHPALPEPSDADRGGSATHLGDAVAQVVDEAAGREVAGLVVVSDGQNTGGRSPAEAARAASEAGAPIFAVPAGSAARVQDVAIADVVTSGLVAVGDKARVAVTVESQGFDGRPVKLQLLDGETVLDQKDMVLRGSEPQVMELSFEAKQPGAKYLTVRIPPPPEEPEALRENDSDIAFVRVSDERLRVLHIEGPPRWDFRFLKNATRRDHGLGGRINKEQPDIVLEAEWRRLPDDQQRTALPQTLDELADYHVVVLGDASPRLVDARFVELLSKAVRERGLGLVVAAGTQAMPQAFDERLHDLLPVKLRRKAGGLEAPPGRPFTLQLSPEGEIHDSTRFYDDAGRNKTAWEHLPPYGWCSAVVRPAPGATVLVWNPSVQGDYGKLPLVAQHFAGRGRVLFVGTDSTFLWRQNVGDRFFYKFWGQAIRAVARKDEKLSKSSWIEVRPARVQPGEPAEVELMAVAPDGTPRGESMLAVKVSGGGETTTIELAADPAMKGHYTGRFTPTAPGDYRLAYEPGGESKPAEARLRAVAAAEELRRPNVDRTTLEALAGGSGGEVVELADLATIPGKLKGETKVTHRHEEATLWDNGLTLALLVLIYSIDVGLRRLAGLS